NRTRLQPIGVGAVLGLAVLTRPTGLYLPLILVGIELVVAFRRRSQLLAQQALILLFVSGMFVTPWIIRNYVLFGVPRLTSTESLNLLYGAGASAYSVQHKVPLEEAQWMIHTEFGTVVPKHSNKPWQSDRSEKQMDEEM